MSTEGASIRVTNLVPANDLTSEREAWLIDGLVGSLPSLRMEKLFALRRDMFIEADLITVAVAQPDGTAVGALSSRWAHTADGQRFLHVTTQFVGDAYRNGPIFRQSWATHLKTLYTSRWGFPALTALKTYNPMVYCLMRSLGRLDGVDFYPGVDGVNSSTIEDAACRVAHALGEGHPFDPATGVISGIGVPADLYPEMPVSRDSEVNAYFEKTTQSGDRILCMLSVPTKQAVANVLHAFVGSGRRKTGDRTGAGRGPVAAAVTPWSASTLGTAHNGIPGTEL